MRLEDYHFISCGHFFLSEYFTSCINQDTIWSSNGSHKKVNDVTLDWNRRCLRFTQYRLSLAKLGRIKARAAHFWNFLRGLLCTGHPAFRLQYFFGIIYKI